jgi:hypothetical protein
MVCRHHLKKTPPTAGYDGSMQQDLFTFPFCSPTRETQFEPGTTGNLQAGQAKQKLEERAVNREGLLF